MADYWKSQAKKFCDFCKCWIADNKPSIGFHESGKRHKENVAKRISEISKNSAKSHQEALQVDSDMRKMEEEAMKAYMRDLQENPDYTSQKILEETERLKKELEESVRKQREDTSEGAVKTEAMETETAAATSPTKLWHEAKSEEGYTYFWNINTSESVWEPPAEGFVSLEEQEKQAKIKEEMKKREKEEKARRKEEELKALKEKESSKKKKKKGKDEEKEEVVIMGPAPKADPYGGWTVVEPKVDELVDLELPQQEFVAVKVPELSEPEVRFKEKTISSLETDETKYHGFVKREHDKESAESFKKRKLNRGNMRQKLDTD